MTVHSNTAHLLFLHGVYKQDFELSIIKLGNIRPFFGKPAELYIFFKMHDAGMCCTLFPKSCH